MSRDLIYLLSQSKTGDDESILEIIERFIPLIIKYSRKLNYEDAENELIEKLLSTLYKMPELKKESQIVVYISKAILTAYIQLSKKKSNCEKTEILTDELYTYENNSNAYFDNDKSIYLKDALNKLTDTQKNIIIFYFYYGYKDSEISKLIGISRQAIYKNKQKAFTILKKELSERV